MSSTRRPTWLRGGALAGCALSLLACSPASDVASLGTYFERSEDDDVDARIETAPDANTDASSEPTPDANFADTGTRADASSDAGQPDGSSDDIDPFPADAPPCARTGCVSSEAPTQADPNVHCQMVIVGAGTSPPLPPDSPANHFVGFNFTPQIQGMEYLRSISPIVDDAKVLHHMKLSQVKPQPTPYEPGAATDPRQFQFPARLIYSWAPGGSALYLDPSVGVAVAPNTNYVAEFHYGDEADKVFDGSGFKLCFTPSAPKHLVSFSGLRAKGPPAGPATGLCPVQHTGPVVLLSAQPNSSVIGRNVKLVLDRPGSLAMTLLNEPYDHDFVPYRTLSVLLRAGDILSTRCDNVPPAVPDFDARCEVTMLHWPAHTLVSGSSGGQTSELESCPQ